MGVANFSVASTVAAQTVVTNMGKHFPNLTSAPHGQWRYTVPETGQHLGPYPDTDSLLYHVRNHYNANGYSVPENLWDLIESQMCADLGDYCVGEDPVPDRTGKLTVAKVRKVTFHTVLTGTKRLLGIPTSVPQSEATRRALICSTCPENVGRQDCARCHLNTLRDMVVKIVGTRRTPYDDKLKVCRVCLCELKAKVSIPLADLNRMTTEEERAMLPAHCWQLDPVTEP